MKTIIYILLISLSTSYLSYSQQLPLYSRYLSNTFLLNPAIAGNKDYVPVRLTVRNQWVNIKNAPATQAVSAHSKIRGSKLGLGGILYNDKFGATGMTGVQASAAYHLLLGPKDTRLSFGLSLSAMQFTLDETSLTLEDDVFDEAVTGTKEAAFVPDANFGMYLYHDDWYIGLSAAQLVEFDLNVGTSASRKNFLTRHYYLQGGYKFKTSRSFELEPSFLVKGTERSPFQADINLEGIYKQNYSVGISYRSNKSIILMTGIKFKNYYFGYAFDIALNTIRNYSSGSHEFVFGININERTNKGSSLL